MGPIVNIKHEQITTCRLRWLVHVYHNAPVQYNMITTVRPELSKVECVCMTQQYSRSYSVMHARTAFASHDLLAWSTTKKALTTQQALTAFSLSQ